MGVKGTVPWERKARSAIARLARTASLLLVAVTAVALAACSSSSSSDNSTGTAPTVTGSAPAADATNVALDTVVTATFSVDMQADTLNATTFTVAAGSTAVSGTVTYSGDTATFTPGANLSPNTTYTATIGTGALASDGTALAAPYTWSFTTGQTVLSLSVSTVAPLYPTNGANWNDYVKNDGADATSATDDPCTGTGNGYSACIHGGEYRAATVSGVSTCDGLTATDSAGALTWVCLASGGSVRVVSTGLNAGKGLSDLIDWTADPIVFKSLTVNVTVSTADATGTAQSTPAVWWANALVPIDASFCTAPCTVQVQLTDSPSGTPLTNPIYLFTDNAFDDSYALESSKLGFVVDPGVTMGNNDVNDNVYAFIDNPLSFLWIEGALDATGYNGVYLGATFSVLRNVSVTNASDNGVYLYYATSNRLSYVNASQGSGGVYLDNSDYNRLSHVTASGNTVLCDCPDSGNGIYLGTSSHNTLESIDASANPNDGINGYNGTNNRLVGVTAMDNSGDGVYFYGASQSVLSDIHASNNAYDGVGMDFSNNNVLTGITASSNGDNGVYLGSANNNVLAAVTAANNYGKGVYVTYSKYNMVTDVAAANNYGPGLYLDNAVGNAFSNVAAAANGHAGQLVDVYLAATAGSPSAFSGLLKVGGACSIDPTETDLTDVTCAPKGNSTATLSTVIDVAGSFEGMAGSDAVNTDGGADGTADFDTLTDWSGFENAYRAWGLDSANPFPNPDQQGSCMSGDTCRIWDWSLKGTDNALRAVLALPTGNDVLVHAWDLGGTTPTSDADCEAIFPGALFDGDGGCQSTVLQNATEVPSTGGNDNGLCEAGETCLVAPNIGSYQGHGAVGPAGSITSGILSGTTLLEFGTNGY